MPWCDRLPHALTAIWREAKEESEKARERQKRQFDKHRDQREKLSQGDAVWLLRPEALSGEGRKLALPYYGPFKVTYLSPNGYARIREYVDEGAEEVSVNVDRLTRCEPAILEANLQEMKDEQKVEMKERRKQIRGIGASAMAVILGVDHRKYVPQLSMDQLVEFRFEEGIGVSLTSDTSPIEIEKRVRGRKVGPNQPYKRAVSHVDFSEQNYFTADESHVKMSGSEQTEHGSPSAIGVESVSKASAKEKTD